MKVSNQTNQKLDKNASFWGFVKVSASTCEVKIADCRFNTEKIIERLTQLNKLGVNLAVFPELAVTAYCCGDLFYQKALLDSSTESITKLVEFSKSIDTVFAVGAPFFNKGLLFNAAFVIFKGKILGIVPKTFLPNYSEFSERRQFAPAPKTVETVTVCNQAVPFGTDIIFNNRLVEGFSFACEVCEDVWVSTPPSSRHAENGAVILCNLSASNEVVGKADYRRTMVLGQASKTISTYIYSSCGVSESTTDLLFSGHNIIAENRHILAETPLFSETDAICEIDVNKLTNRRHKLSNFRIEKATYTVVDFELPLKNPKALGRQLTQTPFVPSDRQKLTANCQLVSNIQGLALAHRVSHINAKKLVIGVSGGLDSTLALLACKKAVEALKKPMTDIVAVSMPCFGTTDRTKNNAKELAQALGTTFLEIDISKAVLQHFEDIGHDKNITDTVFENSQARERTQVLMDMANKLNGLVVGTGDMSEAALGFSTFNGDHMSMYNVNCSVPKTLIKHILQVEAETLTDQAKAVILDIIHTPISPELTPHKEGKILQQTEEIVGPYMLTDFFLYHFIKGFNQPSKILFLAENAFKDVYDTATLKKWLKNFLKRFFTQQFKRNCVPDGIKVGGISLSPRADWRMPSDAMCTLWLEELEDA